MDRRLSLWLRFVNKLLLCPPHGGTQGEDAMTAVTLQDVSAYAERESVFWYFTGAMNSAMRSMVMWLFLPFLLIGAVILAQLYPFRILATLRQLNAALPCIDDDEELELIRDMLSLAYAAGKFYQRLCVFRGRMHAALEECDETLDSLKMVLTRSDELEGFVLESERLRTPDMQLPLEYREKIAL